MPPLAEAFVRIRPATQGFEAEARRDVGKAGAGIAREGAKHGKAFGSTFVKSSVGPFRSLVGVVGGPLVGAFAAVAGVKAFAGFVGDARESIKVGKLTAQVIKTTGGAAKISADQVGALATAISNKTGVDDEAVQTGANLILTFKSIKREGSGLNDVFGRATAAAVDLSKAGFGDINGASKMLGKALNDPIRGITALGRAGVTFTDQQKKQIAAFVKSGDVLSAQKVILKEVESQVGGAAAATGTSMDKLKVIVGNVGERIGGFFVPAIDKAAEWLGKRLPGAMEVAAGFLEKGRLGVSALVAAFQDGDVTSDGFVGVMERIGVAARDAFTFFKAEVLPRLKEFGAFLVGTAIPAVGEFVGWIVRNRNVLIPLAAGIGAIVAAVKVWIAVSKAFAAAQVIVNVVLAANPIGIVIVALIGVAAALVVAYKRSETFRQVVSAAWEGVKKVALSAWNDFLKPIFSRLVTVYRDNAKAFSDLRVTLGRVWAAIKETTRKAVAAVVDFFLGMFGSILDGAAKAFGWVPKLGPKLRAAAAEFGTFRDDVNKRLSGLKDKNIAITAHLRELGIVPKTTAGLASGGVVPFVTDGPRAIVGEGRRSHPEYVIPTDPQYRTRALKLYEELGTKMYAAGGVVGFRRGLTISPRLAGKERFDAALAAYDQRLAKLAKSIEKAGSGGAGLLGFMKAHAGDPYGWGMSGPHAFDCSGWISALTNRAQGRANPYTRRFSTGTLPAGLFAPGLGGRFQIGWFAGNPGHVAATIGGVNTESRGGDGVVVGSRARGARSSLFSRFGHLRGFATGGVLPGDAPFDLLDRRGRYYRPGLLDWLLGRPFVADRGVLLPPGPSVVDNRTGRPETLRRVDQPVELGPRTIRALGEVMGQVVVRGLAGSSLAVGRTADLYVRGG